MVLKRGAAGALLVECERPAVDIAPFNVKVVDTTAAGDAFAAALAVGMTEGMPLAAAALLGNAAGALCCTQLGAQPALPRREAVDKLLRS